MLIETKAKWILAVGIIVIYVITMVDATMLHEEAHAQIGAHHGCIDGEIRYLFFEVDFKRLGPQTIATYKCHEYAPRSTEEAMQEKKLHMQNEIVRYNTASFQNLIVLSVFLIGYLMILLRNKEDKIGNDEEDVAYDK